VAEREIARISPIRNSWNKNHPELSGDYPPNGKNYEGMFRYASDHGIPILVLPIMAEDRLSVFEQMAREYPDAPLIIAHGAFGLGYGKSD
jgi:hypothetical protein